MSKKGGNMSNGLRKIAFSFGLLIILLAIMATSVGCRGQAPPPPSPSTAADLASTLVPNVDLDVYVYCRQANATKVPTSLIGAPIDITVESLAIWGIANENKYSVGGALTFTSAADAGKINSQISGRAQVWTRLADQTIYFVQGSGGPGENLKSIIARTDFKKYDDGTTLKEIAMMPAGASTKPAIIGVIKPNQAMVNLMKGYVDANTAETMDAIFTWAKPQVITFGLFSPQQIELSDIVERLAKGTIWDFDLGVLASVKSSIPGIIVSPIATRFLDNAGYPKTEVGGLTIYKRSLTAGSKAVPVLLNVDGDRVFLSVSAKEAYAQTLMTSVKR